MAFQALPHMLHHARPGSSLAFLDEAPAPMTSQDNAAQAGNPEVTFWCAIDAAAFRIDAGDATAAIAAVQEGLRSALALQHVADICRAMAALGGIAIRLDRLAGGGRLPESDGTKRAPDADWTGRHEAASAGDGPQSPLTYRELDVLRLVMHGRSNRVIGERLCISERTVESHVGHILAKLDLDSRAAAAAWAVRNGIA